MKKSITTGSVFKSKRSGKFIKVGDPCTITDYVNVSDYELVVGEWKQNNARYIHVSTLRKNYEPVAMTEDNQVTPGGRKRYQTGDIYHSRRSNTHVEIVEDDGTNVIIREVEAKLVVVYSAVEGSERVVKSSSVASSYYK
jgi:hypothetical protein